MTGRVLDAVTRLGGSVAAARLAAREITDQRSGNARPTADLGLPRPAPSPASSRRAA